MATDLNSLQQLTQYNMVEYSTCYITTQAVPGKYIFLDFVEFLENII